MSRRKRPSAVRLVLLLIAVAVLGIIIWRSVQARTSTSDAVETPTVIVERTEAPTANSESLFEPLGSLTPAVNESSSTIETPADQWANAVLNLALPLLNESIPSLQGMSWWSSDTPIGDLNWNADTAIIDESRIELSAQNTLEIAILRTTPATSVDVIADASPNAGALHLTLNQGSQSWLLSGSDPVLALKALVTQAGARDLILKATYLQEARTIQIVLLGAFPIDSLPTETPMVSGDNPLPTIIPTATREFDPYIGQLVGKHLDPAIQSAMALDASITQQFIQRHPWTGILTANETDIRIGGRSIPIDTASALTFYLLQGDQESGVSRVLSVLYNSADSTTRFPEDQVFFQAHRMKEVVFWAVSRAAQVDGQIIAAFDDYGNSQSITIIGFKPFQR